MNATPEDIPAGLGEIETGRGGLAKLVLTGPGGSAEIYLHGAHVTSFVPADGDEMLWLSGSSWFEKGKPIRGGVPICFPWFGPCETNPDLPSHGFARLCQWSVESVVAEGDTVSATLGLDANECTRSYWDFDFQLRYRISVRGDGSLELALTTQNTDQKAFVITEALHTYFGVVDVRQVEITGLAGAEYLDKMDSAARKTQHGAIRFTAETDRVYLNTTDDCILSDPAAERQIRVTKDGSDSTVVWNPWIGKAGRMEDFGDDEWPGMVCIETANAHDNAVTIQPGQLHTISTTLSRG